MEELMLPAFNPHLKKVLRDFQSAAVRSLSGPSNYAPAWMEGTDLNEYRKALLLTGGAGGLKKEAAAVGESKLSGQTPSREGEPFFTPPPLPVQQMPLFMPMDASKSEKSETILEGETIACFIVGGEKRLCLPQILNTVLREIELPQINAVCDELHIFCSRCNSDQLNILKMSAVLPWSAPSCGLITKTDSERLCNALLHSSLERSREPPSRNSFKVYHECFGKCKGIFSPELYTNPHAKCIECFDCHGMFSPQKFVCHSHKALENRTCHWGFDSAKWRSYLLIAKDQEGKDRAQNALDSMKAKFDFTSCYKRKESEERDSVDGKKARYEETVSSSLLSDLMHVHQMSAFQPWAPSMKVHAKMVDTRDGMVEALPSNLHTGRPILLNPERVVPHSESHRYERHFAPNVSLAPAPYQKTKESEVDKEKGSECDIEMRPRTPSSATLSTPLSANEPFTTLSSDTEESQSETVSPRDDRQVAMERAMRVIQEMMSQDCEADAKERLLREFVQLHCADEERVADLVKENKFLRQEVEAAKAELRDKLREASHSKKVLYKEIDRLLAEHKQQMKELGEQVQFLRMELDTARKPRSLEVAKTKAKYKGQLTQLTAELYQYKQQQQQLQQQQLQQQQQNQQQQQSGHHPSDTCSQSDAQTERLLVEHPHAPKQQEESTLEDRGQETCGKIRESTQREVKKEEEEVTVDGDV